MSIALTKQERLLINQNPQVMPDLAEADLIQAVDANSGQAVQLWKRPMDELKARGPCATIVVFSFETSCEEDVRDYQAIVDRLTANACKP